MANEMVHGTVGTTMTQVEFEAVGLHVLNNQVTGDLIYASSATQLSRLGIGATNSILTVIGGVSTWQTTLAGLTLTSPTINGTVATTGLTMPAFTLGGTLTITGQVFNAGADIAQINSSVGGRLLTLNSTSTGGDGGGLKLVHDSASPADGDYTEIEFHGRDSAANLDQIARFIVEQTTVTSASEVSTLGIYLMNAGALASRLSLSGAGVLNIVGSYQVDAVQVVGNRVIDARCDDAINSGDGTTDGVIDSLRDAMITHGLIAAA